LQSETTQLRCCCLVPPFAHVSGQRREEAASRIASLDAQLESKENAAKAMQEYVASLEQRLQKTIDARDLSPTHPAVPGSGAGTHSGGNDEFNYPDCVWNCGNSEILEFVQKLVSENVALRKLKNFVSTSQGSSLDTSTEHVRAGVDSNDHVTSLVDTLLKQSHDAQVCAQVCSALENLTFTDTQSRKAITLCGGVEAILGLLEQDDDDMSLLRPAMDTLWNLTFEEESVDRVTSAGGIRRLFEVMRKQANSTDLQCGACAVLLNLSVREPNRWTIVQEGGVELIAQAMRRHTECEEVLEQGCQALYMLAYHQDLRPLVLAAKGGEAAALAAAHLQGTGGAQKWGRWLQDVLTS